MSDTSRLSGILGMRRAPCRQRIVGHMRRATPPPFLLLEAFAVYASFLAAGLCLRWMDGPSDFLRVARLTAIIMAGLLLRDAYSERPIPSLWLNLIDPRIYQTVYFSCGLQWSGSAST